jgi:thiamine pyridinylase
VYIASAPIGKGKNPVLFVDTLVKRKDCNAQCEDAATKFALYLNLPTTQEWILMSRDSNKQATPRYLIPATKSAFKQNLVSKDKYYKKIESEIKNGVAYPNTGLPAIRSKMRDAILAELKKP